MKVNIYYYGAQLFFVPVFLELPQSVCQQFQPITLFKSNYQLIPCFGLDPVLTDQIIQEIYDHGFSVCPGIKINFNTLF